MTNAGYQQNVETAFVKTLYRYCKEKAPRDELEKRLATLVRLGCEEVVHIMMLYLCFRFREEMVTFAEYSLENFMTPEMKKEVRDALLLGKNKRPAEGKDLILKRFGEIATEHWKEYIKFYFREYLDKITYTEIGKADGVNYVRNDALDAVYDEETERWVQEDGTILDLFACYIPPQYRKAVKEPA